MSFRELELKPEYRSRLDNVIENFYNPVLRQSVVYKRAVGFFSSSALVSLKDGLSKLLDNGGTIQIITSPRISSDDIAAINDGFKRRADFSNKFSANKNSNLLSDLVASKRLEIKIALIEDDNLTGMFHEKLGLMYDVGGNVIAFSGSMNESANAFVTNYESIDVFTSWTSDAVRVQRKQFAFNSMWANCERGIKVLNFSEVNAEVLREYQREYQVTKKASKKSVKSSNEIKIPVGLNLRDYQQEAIEGWAKNSYVGIFDMATGTGKTYTALAGVTKLFYAVQKNLAVIIVCPYKNLVDQWAENILKFEINPLVCYSEKRNWRARFKNTVMSFNFGVEKFFCAVMTEATFSSADVQNILHKLKGRAVLIADEAHRFGAAHLNKNLPQNFTYRLALSATIERQGDAVGTQRIYDYFGAKCIEYPLQKAIANDMLTPYYYYPILVSLDTDELESYLELTAKIAKIFYTAKDKAGEYTKLLSAQRARIVAGAKNKIAALRQLIPKYKDDNQILIYCGAAKINDERQIDVVTEMLGNEFNMRVKKFTCEEKAQDRQNIKENFAEGKHLQALVAIRCLDEGIDIPSVKTAFILASSGNYREYVQRRGRLLRKFHGKNYAVIFDFVTLPIPLTEIKFHNAETIQAVKSLVQKEVARVKDFAALAENPFDADILTAEIQVQFGAKEDN